MNGEVDIGRLSPAEAVLTPATTEPSTYPRSEQESDWLYYALSRARTLRGQMEAVQSGSPDWAALRKKRLDAIESALKHLRKLQGLHGHLTKECEAMLLAEGL